MTTTELAKVAELPATGFFYLEDFVELAHHWMKYPEFGDPWNPSGHGYITSDQALCTEHGHDWVDNSYGGPNSGCIHMDCRRCGESYHHTLY